MYFILYKLKVEIIILLLKYKKLLSEYKYINEKKLENYKNR